MQTEKRASCFSLYSTLGCSQCAVIMVSLVDMFSKYGIAQETDIRFLLPTGAMFHCMSQRY